MGTSHSKPTGNIYQVVPNHAKAIIDAELDLHGALSPWPKYGKSHSPAHVPHIKLFTFGARNSHKHDIRPPVLCEFDLRNFRCPPRWMIPLYTGLDREILDSFWSHPEHEYKYQRALTKIKRLVMDLTPADPYTFAVLVYCHAGTHRSVVFMRRLYRDLKRWPQITVSARHLDLREACEKRFGRGGYGDTLLGL